MAKLYSTPAQLIALRGMCSRDREVSGRLIANLDESHFHGDECIETFRAIHRYIGKAGEPPAYRVLAENVNLSKDTRELLRTVSGVVKTKGEVESLIDNLQEYRKTRLFYTMFTEGLERLSAPGKIDLEDLMASAQDQFAAIQLNRNTEDLIIHLGRDDNSASLVEELLYGESTDQFIPTGFKTFDSVNGGMIRGSLVTLGGASGAGKCVCGETTLEAEHVVMETEAGEIFTFLVGERITVLTHTGSRVTMNAEDFQPELHALVIEPRIPAKSGSE